MKKISYFWNKILNAIFLLFNIIVTVVTLVVISLSSIIIMSQIYKDEGWDYFNEGPHNLSEWIIEIFVCGVLAALTFLILYLSATIPRCIIDLILQCNSKENLTGYPAFYHLAYLNPQAQSHKQILRAIPTHKKAYTIGVIFTYNEMKHMVDRMKTIHCKYYEASENFLLPDHVSALRPRIFLRDARKILSQMRAGQSAVLVYIFHHPRRSQIWRHDEVILINANLDQSMR